MAPPRPHGAGPAAGDPEALVEEARRRQRRRGGRQGRLARRPPTPPISAGRGAAALVTAVAVTVAAAVVALPAIAGSGPRYPLLVSRPGLNVYGPPLGRSGCPALLPLSRGAAATVRRAVALAMPAFERRLKLDGRDARVRVGPATRSGYSAAAGGCGRRAWQRSLIASVLLPHVRSASLGQHTFAVGRMRTGWVLWGWIH